MSKPKEFRPKSFTDFVKIVDDLQSQTDHSLWYRGAGRSRYTLQPSLYRHQENTSIEDLALLERSLMLRFRQRSIPFHNRSLQDEWDAMFFMQHYGVPTRLLDWTENPFIGFYFAALSSQFDIGNTGALKFKEDAAVWILDPVSWNRHALGHLSFEGGVVSADDDALKAYKPPINLKGMFNLPVAMYGAHNSARIVAQRGVFAVFGQQTVPMESAFSTSRFPNSALYKVILRKSCLTAMRKAILQHGITESVVYPDLTGLACEIRREFGFEA